MHKLTTKPGIYLITNIINNKSYVGRATNIQKRSTFHKYEPNYEKTKNYYLSRAIAKYKWENFKISIIESFDQISDEELNKLEIYYIKKLNTLYPYGYNLTEGGGGTTGYKPTEETKQKMREAALKQFERLGHPRLGKHCSEERKKQISMQNKGQYCGKLNPFYGKTHSQEMKEQMSRNRKGKGVKPVKQIDIKTGEVIKIWPSVKAAGIGLNQKWYSSISKVCKNRTQGDGWKHSSAFGFKWEYA